MVGDLESLPFDDASFDVTISTGAIEYTDAAAAMHQLARVTRPSGLVVVSMLNPLNPYWLSDWFLCQPALRLLSLITRMLRIPVRRWSHGPSPTGIRALRSPVLGRYLRRYGLIPANMVYFGFMPLIRPLDRIPAVRRWIDLHSGRLRTTGCWRRWMATGYVIVARREELLPGIANTDAA